MSMAGQGCPLTASLYSPTVHGSQVRGCRSCRAIFLVIAYFVAKCLLLGFGSPIAQIDEQLFASELTVAVDDQKPIEMRLQFQFTCDNPTRLEGALRLDSGSLSQIENLSLEPNTTGAFWTNESRDQLQIQPRGFVKQLGFSVDFVGTRSATISIELNATRGNQTHLPRGSSDQTIRIAIPVQDLVHGTFDQQIAGGVQLRASRVGGDAMRIQIGDQDRMIFSAGQDLSWNIETTLPPDLGKRSLALQLELRREGDKAIVWQQTRNVSPEIAAQVASGQKIQISEGQWTLPQVEGVYSFTARLAPSTAFRLMPTLPGSRFFGILGESPSALERRVQFVVLGPFPDEVDPSPLVELARWRPENRNALALGLNAASSDQPIAQSQLDGQTVAVIAPQDRVLQSLPTLTKNKPHLLVVRYARSGPVSFTMSVRDVAGRSPHSGGRNEVAVVDSQSVHSKDNHSVAVSQDSTIASQGLWGEYRLVFWPNDSGTELVIKNNSEKDALRIESFSLKAGPSRLAGGITQDYSGRTAAVYLDQPILREIFSANRKEDPLTGIPLDDWSTVIQAGKRLVEYVQYRGANAAIVTVVSEGGALYPSEHFLSTLRFDSGRLYSDGRDPVRKDVLELLFRLFDRTGLRLIPSIELATPLPTLERKIFEHRQAAEVALAATSGFLDQASGAIPKPIPPSPWEWSDSVGRRWVEGQPSRHGLAPYYNLLHQDVQQSIYEVFSEFSERYKHHRSLTAIAISVGNQTYLQLPTPQWGREEGTLRSFRAHLQKEGKVPSELSSEQWSNDPWLNRWIDGPGGSAFANWRAFELTQFYKRLASAMPSTPLGLKTPLVIVPADYVPVESESYEHRGIQHGLDWRALSAEANIVPLRLQRYRRLLDPALRIDDARMNEDEMWDVLMATNAGGLVFYPPQEQRVTSSNSTASSAATFLLPTAVSSEVESQRDLMKLLARIDCRMVAIGGLNPIVGNEDVLVSAIRTFTMLPDVPMSKVSPNSEGPSLAMVRQARVGDKVFVYAVNPTNWLLKTRLHCDSAAGTPVRLIGSEQKNWLHGSLFPAQEIAQPNGTSILWEGVLAPGQMTALEISGPGNGVVQWSAIPQDQPAAHAWTASEVEDLAARIAILGKPRKIQNFVDGGFEAGDERKPNGWLRAQYPENSIRFTSDAVEGLRALELVNAGAESNRTWLLSEIFPAPESGRFAISLRARLIVGTPTLRVALEGKLYGQPVRFTETVQLRADHSWGDSPYWLKVVQPSLRDLQEVRIAIDLIEQGSVAIDDVRLYDFFLTDKERSELQRQTFVASERLKRGDLSIAATLLDSHWSRYLKSLDLPIENASTSPAGPATQESTGIDPATENAGNTPGIAERLRNWLPSPLRF